MVGDFRPIPENSDIPIDILANGAADIRASEISRALRDIHMENGNIIFSIAGWGSVIYTTHTPISK